MSKQLTMKAGVAIFAALALVVALTIYTFSAYQPVAAQQTSENVTRSFSADGVMTGGTVDVTITYDAAIGVVTVTETLPDDWTFDIIVSPSGLAHTVDGQMITFKVPTSPVGPVTYRVTAPNMVDTGRFKGTVAEQDGALIGGDFEVTVGVVDPEFVFPIGETEYPALALTAGGSAEEVRVSATNAETYAATSDNTDVATVGVSMENGYATVTVTPGATTGDATIKVTASNTTGGLTSTTFTATVGNNDPVVGAVSDQRFTAGAASRQVRVTATDADGHTLSYAASSSNAAVAAVTNVGNVLTVNPGETGTATITVTVSDAYGGSDSEEFTVTVTNADPRFVFPRGETAYPDLSFTAGDDPGEVRVTATDSDGHSVTFGAASSDEDVATVTHEEDSDTAAMDTVLTVTPLGAGTATITVTASDGHSGSASTTFIVSVSPVQPAVVLSSYKADTAVTVAITAVANTTIRGGRNIVVTLPGFQFPDGGIDEDEVIIDGTINDRAGSTDFYDRAGSTDFYGNPASVSVSGDKITLSLPTKVLGFGGAQQNTQIAGPYTIFFKQGAGLKTPNASGTKTIEVVDRDSTDHELGAAITPHISVKPGWVMRGDTFTITGKGINAPGDTTAHLYSGTWDPDRLLTDPNANLELVESSRSLVLGRDARDAGTVVVDGIDTTHSSFVADAIDATSDADAKGYNLIVMVDAAGNVVGYTRLGIQPSVSLDVTEVRRTGRVEVSVSDWYYGNITDAYINGIQVNLPDNTHTPHDANTQPDEWIRGYYVSVGSDNKETFTVVVDRDVRLGEMEVRLVGSTKVKQGSYNTVDVHKQTVDVGFFDLTLTPSTAVTDQVIRIEGTGFGLNVCIVEITVGEEHIRQATTGDRVTVGSDARNCVLTDSDGDVANSFKVPYNLKPDDYKVVVRDVNNRVGEAVLTVPKPAITLSPEASQRGSTVTVVGENFPAQDVIGITYGGDTVTVATTDTVGKWRATFKVPVDSTIGREYEVVAQSDKKGDGQQSGPTTPPKRANLNAKATHTVPEETLKVWPRGQAEPPDDSTEVPAINYGGRLEVSATNLPPHTKVSLWIGSIPVAGRVLGEDAAADSAGRYTDSVLVPQLTPGTHTVELAVHTIGSDVVVVTFVEILDIVTRPTTDVFEDLIAAGQLVVVWHYDNETGTWAAYDPNIPPHINDLNLLSTGDIVWVEVTERVQFQGQTLFQGANLISLD